MCGVLLSELAGGAPEYSHNGFGSNVEVCAAFYQAMPVEERDAAVALTIASSGRPTA